MALTTAKGSAGYLNRAFNDANASTSTFTTNVADLTASEIAAANKFDDASLTDAALAKKVLTNMGLLPTTNTSIAALEPALADYFATTGKGNRGFVVLQLSRIIADKTGDATYGTAATAWNTEVNDSIASSTGDLTTSATDVLTGSASDDIFTAINSALSAAKTLNATDKISGGSGNDVLNISSTTDWGGFTTGSLALVETVNFTNTTSSAQNFNAVGASDVKTFNIVGAEAGVETLNNLPTGVATIGVTSVPTGTLTTSFAEGAAETSTTAITDAVALNLTNVGASTTTSSLTVNLGSIETVNITSVATGINQITLGGSLTSVTATGAGALTVFNLPADVKSFDASAVTGVVKMTQSGTNTAGALKTIKTGSASDTLTLAMADLAANATIDMGAGSADAVTMSAALGGSVEYTMTGVETLNFTTVNASQTLQVSGAKTTGLSTVSMTSATDSAVNMVNMGATDLTFNSKGVTDDNLTHTSDNTGNATVSFARVGTTAATESPLGDYTFSGAAGVLTVTAGVYINNAGSVISAPKATSLVINGTSQTNALGTTQYTTQDAQITADKAKTVTITSGGYFGAAAGASNTISVPKATEGTVTTGEFASYIEMNAPLMTKLTTTSTGTADFASSTLTTLQTLDVTATKGAVTFGNLAAASSVVLAGPGTTSAVTLGNLGGDNDTDLSISASGFKAGFDVGNIVVSAGYDVSATVTAMKGNVDFDDVNTTGSKADDVSITAVSVDGTVDVGAIYATGDVVVNATNATGAATIGSAYGQTVKLDVRGSASTSTIAATQYAETSADISVNELAAARTGSGYTIAATTLTAATTKALAVKFNGGINQDNLTINGASTTTSITVTGDLGAGTEEVAINATAATAKTVDLSGLLKYETSTIRTGAGADTIVGGAGADIIVGGAGADTMTGGAGNDVFVINSGDSSSTAPDTIVDFLDGDSISFGGQTVSKAIQDVVASATVATINPTLGVATFGLTSAANKETFAQVYALVDAAISTDGASALFSFGGSTYLFISQDTTGDAVVKLTGVAIPATSATAIVVQTTGLGGFGA